MTRLRASGASARRARSDLPHPEERPQGASRGTLLPRPWDPPLYDAVAIGERLARERAASFARVRAAVRRAEADARRAARAPQELTDPEPLEDFDD